MPMVVMAFSGAGSSSSPLSPRRIVDAARIMKEVYAYLWNGSGAADPIPVRVAYVRERFAAIMASNDPEIPPGTFDPLIEHVAGTLVQLCRPNCVSRNQTSSALPIRPSWWPDERGCQRRCRNPGARGMGPGSYAATGCGPASLRNAAARPNVSPMV